MNIKKYVLFGALGILAFVFVTENPIMFGFCQNIAMWDDGTKYCVGENSIPEYIRQLGAFLGISFFLLSLITYKMKEEVFRSWWNFARWWTPTIVIITFLLENAGNQGGLGIGGAISGAFDIFVLSILYIIFILTSLVKITGTYLRTKNK